MRTLLLFLLFPFLLQAQTEVQLLKDALGQQTPLAEDLRFLCDNIGGRVTGSKANEESVEWAYQKFKAAGVKTWKEDFQMPVLWMEGASKFRIEGDVSFRPLAVAKYQTAPGNYMGDLINVGTGTEAEIFAQSKKLKGNFALVEMDLCLDIDGLFKEYVDAANVEAELRKHEVQGIVFMASRPQKLLYRFISSQVVDNDLPQFIMAREDAKRCQRILEEGKTLKFLSTINAEVGGAFTSENVLAEIRGTEKPEEIILIGAHLDSWALGTGANDNGCNVSMLIDIARQMKKLNLQPKRTIRFALWNGEEQGYFGSWAYTQKHLSSMDQHKVAMSIDIGSGEIVGFFTNGREDLTSVLPNFLESLALKDSLDAINVPIIGTDNFDFMLQGVPNLVAAHKPASYGINYHASSDTYDKVDLVSLRKNAKMIASFLWLYANDESELTRLHRNSREEIQAIFEKHETEFSMRMFNVWESWVKGERGRK